MENEISAKVDEVQAPAPIKKPKREKPKSRAKRWADACAEARSKLDDLLAARDAVMAEIEVLKEIQSEFEDWKGNLPENLSGSPLGEKLEEITGIDLEPSEDDIDAISTAIDEAEGADLPLGFGRD